MDSQMLFEDFAPPGERAEPFARPGRFAIITAQIWQCLFSFKDGGDGLFANARAIGGDIRAIAALRQADFGGAGAVTIRLRPKQRQPFQAEMRFRFGATNGYWCVHSASSRAQ